MSPERLQCFAAAGLHGARSLKPTPRRTWEIDLGCLDCEVYSSSSPDATVLANTPPAINTMVAARLATAPTLVCEKEGMDPLLLCRRVGGSAECEGLRPPLSGPTSINEFGFVPTDGGGCLLLN